MIICLCNGISETTARTVAADGDCGHVADIYRRLGCRVQCGKCVPEMRAILREAQAAERRRRAAAVGPGLPELQDGTADG